MPGGFKKICVDCGETYRGLKDSRYCPNCKRQRRVEAGRKGGQATQRAKAEARNEAAERIARNGGIKVGDRVSVRPKTFADGAMYGEVVWIHPELRYAVVEFSVQPQAPRWGQVRPPARLRECFVLMRVQTDSR